MIWIAVAAGGAAGSVARHAVNVLFAHVLERSVPYATAAVNVIGSAVIGVLAGLIAVGRLHLSIEMRTFIFVGILGGFTTFSSYMEQAIRACALVLQAGNFGLVAFDVAEAPADAVHRLPFTTWLRLQRMVEGSQTACLLVGSEPMARSAAGLTMRLGGDRARGSAGGPRFGPTLFDGQDLDARVLRARARREDDVRLSLSTAAR